MRSRWWCVVRVLGCHSMPYPAPENYQLAPYPLKAKHLAAGTHPEPAKARAGPPCSQGPSSLWGRHLVAPRRPASRQSGGRPSPMHLDSLVEAGHGIRSTEQYGHAVCSTKEAVSADGHGSVSKIAHPSSPPSRPSTISQMNPGTNVPESNYSPCLAHFAHPHGSPIVQYSAYEHRTGGKMNADFLRPTSIHRIAIVVQSVPMKLA